MLCGALAGGASSFLTVPMDVVKTRLMTGGSMGNRPYTSLPHAITNIYAHEGISAFFTGWSSRLLHKIPANALFFVFFESFRVLLGAVDKRSEQ
ncbi:solute carrier family 25 protein [archaeon]|nr:MAG: solute carrier family 25 protein [archaeon]